MSLMKVGLAAAAAAAAGAFVLGGTALADTMKSPSPGASGGHGGGGHGGPAHTPVTGDELAKVTAAVRAKDPAVAVDGVHKHADGSYGVFGTKAGSRVGYAVSADLNTVTEGVGGRRGGHGGPAHTPVTGDELAKVTAAVRAKDPAVAVDGVHKHADGSYGVFGTKAGSRVGYAVSADLNTVSEKTARAGRHGKPAPATSATK